MNSSTPWWVTLLVGLAGLGGIIWTQIRADRRAASDRQASRNEREAERQERLEERHEERQFDVYREFIAAGWNLQMALSARSGKRSTAEAEVVREAWQRWRNAFAGMQLLAPVPMVAYLGTLNEAFRTLDIAVTRNGFGEVHPAINECVTLLGTVTNKIREQLGVIEPTDTSS